MKLNRTSSELTREERNKLNQNFQIIESGFGNLKSQIDNIVVEGDSSPEAAQARVGADGTIYPTLKARLDDEQAKKADEFNLQQTNDLLNTKPSKEYVDQLVQGLNAGPKGVYATLIDLQTAYPNGNNNIYVVSADGNWYYYDNGWKSGGFYQGTEAVNQIQSNLQSLQSDLLVNLLSNGDFSQGLEGWTIHSGTPTLDTAVHASYPQSLNVNSTGTSSQIRRPLTFIIGRKYYMAAYVNCTRRSAGTIGFQLGGTPNVTVGRTTITNGFERVSTIHTATLASRTLYVGGLTSANLDGHVDDVAIIDLTAIYGVGKEPEIAEFERFLDTVFEKHSVQQIINPLVTLKKIDDAISNSKFKLRNMVANGNFSNGLNSWTTNAGAPALDNVIAKSAPYSLKANSRGTSSQIRQYINVTSGHKYYLAAQVKCTRYAAGTLGLQLVVPGAVSGINVGVQRITDDWQSVSAITTAASTGNRSLYAGGIAGADLDGNVDDIMVVDLTTAFGAGYEPTKEEFEKLLSEKDATWFNGILDLEISTTDLYKTIKKLNEKSAVPEVEARNAFILQMNKKAHSLGMTQSNFVNPHGLGAEGQLTTASDLIKLGINACGYPELLRIWGKKNYSFDVGGPNPRQISIATTVADPRLDDHYHIFGGKTGTLGGTAFPIQNLITIVEASDNRWLVGVVLDSISDRFAVSKDLYDIANRALQGQDVSGLNVDANYAAVALVPQMHPFAYENYPVHLIYGKSENTQTYPASITKIINAITALDYIRDINEKIEFVASDITAGSGPLFYAGDVLTYKDLLYAMMLPSSNTSANAMARLIGNALLD